jgi:arylsulfatase A-like enzyme
MTQAFPNIVLVVLDTARWDRFGCYGSTRGATPTVDSLAREGRTVETMVSNGPWTLPSHGSLFTGLYPSEHGSQWGTGPRLRDNVKITMAEWFKALGYRTVCATSNSLISHETGLARGFDEYVTKRTLRAGRGRKLRRARNLAVGGDSGGRVVNRWLKERLDGTQDPLFLFVNYLECHWPYSPPQRVVRRVEGPKFGPLEGLRYRMGTVRKTGPWEAIRAADSRTLELLSTLYDAELWNADRHLADLLDLLRNAGRLQDGETIVIVTSDHGEHIGEHGLADHQASVDDHLVRVPFVLWGPGRIPAGSRLGMYEFVDVLPALGELLGAEVPVPNLDRRRTGLFADGEATDGDGLAFGEWRCWSEEEMHRLSSKNASYDFSALRRDLVFVRDQRFKLVRAGGRSERLYDLKVDPMEESDVAADHPEVVERLRQELDRAVDSWRSWGDGADALTAQEAEEIEEHLSALGYI